MRIVLLVTLATSISWSAAEGRGANEFHLVNVYAPGKSSSSKTLNTVAPLAAGAASWMIAKKGVAWMKAKKGVVAHKFEPKRVSQKPVPEKSQTGAWKLPLAHRIAMIFAMGSVTVAVSARSRVVLRRRRGALNLSPWCKIFSNVADRNDEPEAEPIRNEPERARRGRSKSTTSGRSKNEARKSSVTKPVRAGRGRAFSATSRRSKNEARKSPKSTGNEPASDGRATFSYTTESTLLRTSSVPTLLRTSSGINISEDEHLKSRRVREFHRLYSQASDESETEERFVCASTDQLNTSAEFWQDMHDSAMTPRTPANFPDDDNVHVQTEIRRLEQITNSKKTKPHLHLQTESGTRSAPATSNGALDQGEMTPQSLNQWYKMP